MTLNRITVLIACTVITLSTLYAAVTMASGQDGGSARKSTYRSEGAQSERLTPGSGIKVAIDNQSGKDILFVSWRYWGPDYYVSRHIRAGSSPVTIDNFAAEWRIVGVWENNPPPASQPGWSQSYNFQSDVTITILPDKITIN
jgi:hypothetical protein